MLFPGFISDSTASHFHKSYTGLTDRYVIRDGLGSCVAASAALVAGLARPEIL